MMQPSLSDLEQLLRSSRPRPRPQFVRELQASLVQSVAPHDRRLRAPKRQRRRLTVALGTAMAVATLLVVLSLAGIRPLGTGGTPGAAAGRDCTTVTDWVVQREPTLKVGADRRIHIVTEPRLVARPTVRCR